MTHDKFTTDEMLDASQGFSAGNYDAAYVGRARMNRTQSSAYADAYVLGFFSSCERSEVPVGWLTRYDLALSRSGELCRAAGIALD